MSRLVKVNAGIDVFSKLVYEEEIDQDQSPYCLLMTSVYSTSSSAGQ